MGITTPSSFGIILFKRHENAGNVLPALRSRFDQNLDATLGLDQKLWQLVELKARVVPAVAAEETGSRFSAPSAGIPSSSVKTTSVNQSSHGACRRSHYDFVQRVAGECGP